MFRGLCVVRHSPLIFSHTPVHTRSHTHLLFPARSHSLCRCAAGASHTAVSRTRKEQRGRRLCPLSTDCSLSVSPFPSVSLPLSFLCDKCRAPGWSPAHPPPLQPPSPARSPQAESALAASPAGVVSLLLLLLLLLSFFFFSASSAFARSARLLLLNPLRRP